MDYPDNWILDLTVSFHPNQGNSLGRVGRRTAAGLRSWCSSNKIGLLLVPAFGHAAPIELKAQDVAAPFWSPDGQWICYLRQVGSKSQLLKIRPDSDAPAVVLAPAAGLHPQTNWSATGEWIAFSGPEGLTLISPDGKTNKVLSSQIPYVFGFSKDGSLIYAIERNPGGTGPEWDLLSIDIKTGGKHLIGSVDLP